MAKKRGLMPSTKILLQLLANVSQVGVDFFNMLYDIKYHRGWYMSGGHDYVLAMKRLQQKEYARKMLYQLKRSNYIKTEQLGNKTIVSLTEKGEAHTLADKLRRSNKSQRGYTVVIFDIPESQKEARRQFRWLLRQGGFKKLQQSVWVSQTDSHSLLKGFIKKMKLESWVNVFYGNNFLYLPK